MLDLDLRSLAIGPLAAGVGYLSWRYLADKSSRLPKPPGPKGKPIIGNALDIPQEYEWLQYKEFSKQYGDIVYFEALGQGILVLDSLEAINDLLERRGGIYSDRPHIQMIYLTGFDYTFSIKHYGEEWRTYRRHFHQHVHQNVVDQYIPIQTWSTRTFLCQLLETPDNFIDLTRELLGRSIMRMTYDIKTTGRHDPYITLIEDAARLIDDALIPGKYLVEFFPFLRHMPDWLPGAGFKRMTTHCSRLVQQVINKPYEVTKEAIKQGTIRPCMVSRMLDEGPADDPAYDKLVRELGAMAYAAGGETTVSALGSFFLAMRRHPRVQAAAQAELDRVVGPNRMPDLSDHDSLPYIQAILSEVLRWIPVLPLGVPHAATEDDEYRGYLIPKGTIVMHNTWSITHDPEAYPDPEEFKPERFLKEVDGERMYDKSVRDPRLCIFGAGRRICAGRFIAENILWLTIASFLHTFNVEPALDAEGKPIDTPVAINPGFATHVKPFKAAIKPRSARAEALVREAAAEAEI